MKIRGDDENSLNRPLIDVYFVLSTPPDSLIDGAGEECGGLGATLHTLMIQR